MNTFEKKDIVKALGFSPRTIQYYIDEGLIIPEILHTHGRGTKRKFSALNLVQLLLIKRLAQYGISLALIRGVIQNLSVLDWDSFMEKSEIVRHYLILYDAGTDHVHQHLYLCKENEPVEVYMSGTALKLSGAATKGMSYLDRYQSCLVIDVSDIAAQVKGL